MSDFNIENYISDYLDNHDHICRRFFYKACINHDDSYLTKAACVRAEVIGFESALRLLGYDTEANPLSDWINSFYN